MSAFDTLGKSIGTIIDERLSSPLVSSFAIAWSIINYKFFVILLSDTPIKRTFELIKEICFPGEYGWLLYGVVAPAAAAAAYLFLLPKPSLWVYRHWRQNQKNTDDIRLSFEDQKLLTIEESRSYRARHREMEVQVDALQKENEQLKNDLRKGDSDLKLKAVSSDLLFAEAEALKQQVFELEQEVKTSRGRTSGDALREHLDALKAAESNGEPLPNDTPELWKELQKTQRELAHVSKDNQRIATTLSQTLKTQLRSVKGGPPGFSPLAGIPKTFLINRLKASNRVNESFTSTDLSATYLLFLESPVPTRKFAHRLVRDLSLNISQSDQEIERLREMNIGEIQKSGTIEITAGGVEVCAFILKSVQDYRLLSAEDRDAFKSDEMFIDLEE